MKVAAHIDSIAHYIVSNGFQLIDFTGKPTSWFLSILSSQAHFKKSDAINFLFIISGDDGIQLR